MVPFNGALIYTVVIHASVLAVALQDPEAGGGPPSDDYRKNATHSAARKMGTHLQLHRASIGKVPETSRTARDIEIVSPQVDTPELSNGEHAESSRDSVRETNEFPYGVSELPVQTKYKQLPNDYQSKIESDPGESYYYNDFGSYLKESAPKTDVIWKLNDITDPRYIRLQPGQHFHRRPAVEKNSCRQYLEFLRYAFEQLDTSGKKYQSDHRDDYYYYDDDYSQGEGRALNGKAYGSKQPPVIYPEVGKTRSLALNDSYGTESSHSYVRNDYITEAGGRPPKIVDADEKVVPSTVAPAAPGIVTPSIGNLLVSGGTSGKASSSEGSSTKASSSEGTSTEPTTGYEKTHPVTDVPRAVSTTASDQRVISLVGTANATSPSAEAGEDERDGCQDKLFSCPDNVNVTYPVNGYCNRFVVCESGKPNSEFCQEGLHFNLVTGQCDLPHNSFCTYSCPRENGYFGIPGVCGGFFRCTDWYPEYRMCPPRMHWDLKAKICTFQELSSCPLKCDEPYQVKPYSGDCSSYIICTRGKPRYYRCPDGTSFDRGLLKCSPKSLSDCIDDEDYVTRNRGIGNGRKTLCADVQIGEGKSRWCQDTEEDHE